MIIKAMALAMLCATPAMAYEFKCVHEKDTAPPLDPVADGWFLQTVDKGEYRVKKRYWSIPLLTLFLCLAGCSGNYKFSDDDYRPLGEPPMEKRGH